MIYTAPCIIFWMRTYPLRGEVRGGWALEFKSFLGPVKWHRADRPTPFLTVIPQSRQIARFFLHHPLTRECVPPPPPPLWFRVGGHTRLRERGWGVPIPREDRHCGTLGIYVRYEWFLPCAACPVCPWAACPCPVADAPPPPPAPAAAAPSSKLRIYCPKNNNKRSVILPSIGVARSQPDF